ncbi:RNA polymerase sigma factor [Umezawaea sp. NPDC059074]|uniref:RNA polymerase sigma factor n=1 Tax=Umezawaea sp. NPDC059074 TaxID=3346716 RepID=UPI00367700D5
MSSDDDRERRFRALHGNTYADLLRFVGRRVPWSEAEDVVATVFLTVWRRLDDVPEDARPWLFGIARNVLVNQARGWSRKRALDVRIEAEPERVEADGAERTAARVDLERAWRRLTAADREVLALVAFDGLTAAQAAEVLGCRRSAFAMRLGRARDRLARAMGPADNDALDWTGARA